MITLTHQERRRLESLDRGSLRHYQLERLNRLLEAIRPHNPLYREKLADVRLPLTSLDALAELPTTSKSELAGSPQLEAAARNLTYPLDRYVRLHRTSGTRGEPLVVLDTADDWQWWIDTWQYVLDAASITPADRILMAFSFGPFIGFWSAHDAAAARGALVIPSGGLSSLARLELCRASRATALFCTPSYALHLAEVGRENGIQVAALSVEKIVVAGEPGGSIPSVRERIESAWEARVTDHSGATEVGPWGYADAEQRGLHVVESEFVAEFLSAEPDHSERPAGEGELAELVLTTLGRCGSPVVRYRTGDRVRPVWDHDSPSRFVLLDGGVLGRADDMMIIRGVNVLPSSVEQILRSFPEVSEFRLTATRQGEMDALAVEVEDARDEPQRIARQLHLKLGLKVDVRCVAAGSLPRFEGKGKRFIDQRPGS